MQALVADKAAWWGFFAGLALLAFGLRLVVNRRNENESSSASDKGEKGRESAAAASLRRR